MKTSEKTTQNEKNLQSGYQKKILIVDDEDDQMEPQAEALRDMGYDVPDIATNHAEAKKYLSENTDTYLVLIDQNLRAGNDDGRALGAWIATQDDLRHVPYVMLTQIMQNTMLATNSLAFDGFSYFLEKGEFQTEQQIEDALGIIEKIPSVKRKRENALLKQSLQGTVSTWVDFKASLDITFPNEGYTLYQELRLRIIDKIIQIQRARTIEEVSVLFHYFETECDKEYTRLTRLRLNNPNVVSTKIINFRSTRGVQVTQAKVNLCQQYKQDLTNFIDNFTVPHEIQKQWDSDFMYANDKHNQPKSYNTLKGYYSERIHEFHNIVLKIMFDNPLLFKNFERIREFQRWSSIKDAFVSKAQFESTYQEAKGNP